MQHTEGIWRDLTASFVQVAGCRIRTGLQICWALRLKPSAYHNSPQNSASEFVESKFSHIFHIKDPRLQMLVERGRGQVAKLVLDFMRGNGIEVSTTHCNTLISAFQDAFGNVLEEGMKKLRSTAIIIQISLTLLSLWLCNACSSYQWCKCLVPVSWI